MILTSQYAEAKPDFSSELKIQSYSLKKMLKSNVNGSHQVNASAPLKIPRQSGKIRTRGVPAGWAPTAQHERSLGNAGSRISIAGKIQPLRKHSRQLKRHFQTPF